MVPVAGSEHIVRYVKFILNHDTQAPASYFAELLLWCRERGLNPRPSDVSDTARVARHTNALKAAL